MKRAIVLLATVAILVCLFPLPINADDNQFLSLREKNVVVLNSNVELVCAAKDNIFALVNYQGQRYLYFSKDSGTTWQKISSQLSNVGKFVSLEVSDTDANLVAIATTEQVYLSRNGGQSFDESLPGPQAKGEEITSLVITGGVLSPIIIIGIWNPQPSEFAEEGVYATNLKSGWQAQGLKPDFFGKGYACDVVSVTFGPENSLLASAEGDADGAGPLQDGVYLNIGMLNFTTSPTVWNWLSGWPIEVSQDFGQSPKQAEIKSAKMIYQSDSTLGPRVYVLYNTHQRVKDGVYQVNLTRDSYIPSGVERLQVPGGASLKSLDSLAYSEKMGLAVGVTTTEGPAVLTYNQNDWTWSRMKNSGPQSDCQIVVSNEAIFAGTSGTGSCFAKADESNLIPISLMNISDGITQVIPSPTFATDKLLFVSYGNKSVMKVKLTNDYVFSSAQQLAYYPQGIKEIKVRLNGRTLAIFGKSGNIFVFTKDIASFDWEPTKVEINDLEILEGQLWGGGQDGLLYQLNAFGSMTKTAFSGLSWIQKLEPGPQGKLLVIGGDKVGATNSTSLFDGNAYEILQSFPIWTSVVYSSYGDSIYGGVNGQLYRLMDNTWESISDSGRMISKLFFVQKGVYIFSQSRVYLSQFPLSKDSQWQAIDVGSWSGCEMAVDDKTNFIVLWNSEKMMIHNHQISEIVLSPTPTITTAPKPVTPTAQPPKPKPTIRQSSSTKKHTNPVPSENDWKFIIIPAALIVLCMIIIIAIAARRKKH